MKVRTILLGLAVVLVLGAGVAAFVLTRPAPIVDHAPPAVDMALAAQAGWRVRGDGAVLLTPGPDGRLDLFVPGELAVLPAPEEALSWPMLPDAPYEVRAAETSAADGVRIAATILMPQNPIAGAVIIHGSGDFTRRNGWYFDFADYLARRGVAVWFPDKRGTGASEGRWRDASFQTLADDAVAGRAALIAALGAESAPGVGYIGVSQGGWIAPLAAQIEPAPYLLILSAAAVTPNEQLDHEVRANLNRDAPAFAVPLIFPIASNTPRWRYPAFWRANGAIDPVAEIAASGAPTLVLLGDLDEYDNVPVARSIELYRRAPAPIEVMVVEGGGHDLSPGDAQGPIYRPALERARAFIEANAAKN